MKVNLQYPEIFQPIFSLKKRFKVAHGGRGSGKTETIARFLIIKALSIRGNILCLREIQKSIDVSVYSVIRRLISKMKLDSYFDVQSKKIICKPTGCQFLFHGLRDLTVDNIKSIDDIEVCWVEEAHNVTEQSWDVLRPSIRGNNSEIWISFNRKRVDDPVWVEFCKEKDKDVLVIEANYYDNVFFPDVLELERKRDKKKRSEDVYNHIWLGSPLTMEGLCYPYFNRSTNVITQKEADHFDKTCDRVYIGIDWGFDHPLAMVRIAQIGERYVVCKEYNQREKTINLTWLFEDFHQICNKASMAICDNARPELIRYCDRDYKEDVAKIYKTKNANDLSSMYYHNVKFRPCIKYPDSVLDEIDLLNGLFQDKKILISEELDELIKQVETWSWKEKSKKDQPEALGEDLCRALGYAIMYIERTKKNQISVV